jgi:hypothetical protein
MALVVSIPAMLTKLQNRNKTETVTHLTPQTASVY